jgi:colicin import membrane protein
MMKNLLLSLGLLLATHALAQSEPELGAERARIEAQRRQVEERFAAEEKACRARFAVTDCTNEASQRRREALQELRRQEVRINGIERERKAAERLREIEERQSPEKTQDAARKRAHAQEDHKQREQRAASKAADRQQDQAEKAAAGPAAPREPKARASAAAQAEARRLEHEDRLAEAREHKEKSRKRQAERTKPPAQPLPVPQ